VGRRNIRTLAEINQKHKKTIDQYMTHGFVCHFFSRPYSTL